jgi:hypothetical protein
MNVDCCCMNWGGKLEMDPSLGREFLFWLCSVEKLADGTRRKYSKRVGIADQVMQTNICCVGECLFI